MPSNISFFISSTCYSSDWPSRGRCWRGWKESFQSARSCRLNNKLTRPLIPTQLIHPNYILSSIFSFLYGGFFHSVRKWSLLCLNDSMKELLIFMNPIKTPVSTPNCHQNLMDSSLAHSLSSYQVLLKSI